MDKKLAISSIGYGFKKYEDLKRKTYENAFSSRGFDVSFFDWNNYSNGFVNFESYDGQDLGTSGLNSFDAIYLSSLGPVEGKESKLESFFRDLDRLSLFVANDPKTMLSNLDKKYLLDLQDQGVSVIPTVEVGKINYDELNSFFVSDDVVLKPRKFGERGRGVFRMGELDEEGFDNYVKANWPVLAQPFLRGIVENGERSFVFVGSDFSHGVYRHRSDWKYVSGTAKRKLIEPNREESSIIRDVIDFWPSPYHVSRFDFIVDDGKSMLSEVEMVNPNVWMGRGLDGLDERFSEMLSDHISSCLV